MARKRNHRIVLVSQPHGLPSQKNFRLEEVDVLEPTGPAIIVQVLCLSIDTTIRVMLREGEYADAALQGPVLKANGVGRVTSSTVKGYSEGDLVIGVLGLQEIAVIRNAFGVEKIDSTEGLPPECWLSVLGTAGLAAYFGLLKIGKPKCGELVLVSAAAGAVGSIVGQIAKLKGCTVIGITGSQEKCRYLKHDLNFDDAINYKADQCILDEEIDSLCQDGVDIYFDNVGGEMLDAALANLGRHGRIVLCGAISQYNSDRIEGPCNYLQLLYNSGRIEGFKCDDFKEQYVEARKQLIQWIRQGSIKYRHSEFTGLGRFVEALNSIFEGRNIGRCILRIAPNV